MSGSRTITVFIIDISPSMAEKTTIRESVYSTEKKQYEEVDRELSFVELAGEVVFLKLKEPIFGGLKTNKCMILTYGSPRTNNIINDNDGGYDGVDMIWPIKPPELDTLDLVRKLRAAGPDEAPEKADPMDALVVAISTIMDPEHGGLKSGQRDTWTRNIYLITDASKAMDISDVGAIQDSLLAQKIGLKVVGVNFDDDLVGFKQKDKPTLKRQNEAFWHRFLDGVPDSGVASIDYVYQDNLRPEVKLSKPAMRRTTLTLGRPDNAFSDDPSAADKLLTIDVRVGKMISIARPITQRKVSLASKRSALMQQIERSIQQAQQEVDTAPSATPSLPDYSRVADAIKRSQAKGAEVEVVSSDGAGAVIGGLPNPPTYGVRYKKIYFKKDELSGIGSEKQEIAGAEPISGGKRITRDDGSSIVVPVDEEEPEFARGWRLGNTLVPVEGLETDLATKAGIEIIAFHKRALPPYYKMGETYYVMAEDKDHEAQAQVSALATALQELDRFILARWVKSNNAAPLLCALFPPVESDADCLHMVSLPFTNDVRPWTFPPLNRVIDKLGDVIYDHPTLPSQRMQSLTDQLVEATDLMTVRDEDEEETYEFGPPDDILNPYIHRLKAEVVNRVMDSERPIKAPHDELTRHFVAPESVLKSMSKVREQLEAEGFLPQHRGRIVTKGKKRVRAEEGEEAGETEVRQESNSVARRDFAQEGGASPSKNESDKVSKRRRTADDADKSDGSITEDESDDGRHDAKDGAAGATRLIGLEDPVQDFQRELDAAVERGEAMENAGSAEGSTNDEEPEDSAVAIGMAMRSMEQVIRLLTEGQQVVGKKKDAFEAERSTVDFAKARDCVREYRAAAIKLDETERFNDFIRAFKKQLVESKHDETRAFWADYLQGNKDCGLITTKEDKGNTVKVSDAQAEQFINA